MENLYDIRWKGSDWERGALKEFYRIEKRMLFDFVNKLRFASRKWILCFYKDFHVLIMNELEQVWKF